MKPLRCDIGIFAKKLDKFKQLGREVVDSFEVGKYKLTRFIKDNVSSRDVLCTEIFSFPKETLKEENFLDLNN